MTGRSMFRDIWGSSASLSRLHLPSMHEVLGSVPSSTKQEGWKAQKEGESKSHRTMMRPSPQQHVHRGIFVKGQGCQRGAPDLFPPFKLMIKGLLSLC